MRHSTLIGPPEECPSTAGGPYLPTSPPCAVATLFDMAMWGDTGSAVVLLGKAPGYHAFYPYLSACLPVCLAMSPRLPRFCLQPAMPPLLATLTNLPSRFWQLLERSTVHHLQSLLCDYTAHVSLLALHEAIRAMGDTTNQAPVHLCDSWRWLALEGELCAVCDLQATLTMNGVLLTITADAKTPTGV